MGMDLTGIENINEYYTNHYFASIFEENVKETLSTWREASKESGEPTSWSRLREVGRRYYPLRERYNKERKSSEKKKLLLNFATLFLSATGYPETSSTTTVWLRDDKPLPILLQIKKANGAPLMWVMLADGLEDNGDILYATTWVNNWQKSNDEWEELPTSDQEASDSDTELMDYETLLSKQVFSLDEPPRWVLLIGMNQIVLIDRSKWNEKRLLKFDLDEIFSRREETTHQAMAVLLHRDNVCPPDGISLLDTLSDNSHKHASGVSEDLKFALRECIELLGNEVIYDMRNRQKVGVYDKPLATQLTIECLRYMYRILFILFIEARPELGYAPMKSLEYLRGYSLESLRDVAESVREDTAEVSQGSFLQESLNKLFSMIYEGYPVRNDPQLDFLNSQQPESVYGIFTIEPLKAHIFDPERTPLINKAKLRNATLLKIIDLMSISRPRRGRHRPGRISYAALGINQLGAVYEALLSYRGFFAEEKLFEVKRAGTKPDELDVGYFITEAQLHDYTEEERVRTGDEPDSPLKIYEKGTFIYRLAGRERDKSASYYTPELLTRCLVKYALKELLVDKSADDILKLTVCEPAMGSAAFLNEAIDQLAEAYLELKQKETGISISHDERLQELQKVKMYIADRNVYGIDLNPVAVELAEVSLWLNTIHAGAYVPWFGLQLVCGNSLIGARRQVYTTEQIRAKGGTKIWYENAPVRIEPGKQRDRKNQAYHFLMGDPGMADYKDKVIKELAGKKIDTIKAWRKSFLAGYNAEELNALLRLSDTIDSLWARHTETRRKLKEMTTDPLEIFGQSEDPNRLPTTTREKDDIFKRIYLTEDMKNAGPYARLKFAMDYWCALWFWPIDKADLLPTRQEFLLDLSLILQGGVMEVKPSGQLSILDDDAYKKASSFFEEIPEVNLTMLCEKFPRLSIVSQIADRYKFLHWELESADLFEDNGGFDFIIGNPPWIKIEWNEQGVLSDIEPKLIIKKHSAHETARLRKEVLLEESSRVLYLTEYEESSATQDFLCAVQNYPDLLGVQTNLFKNFLPQAWLFNNLMGVSAFIHPDGVYDDPKGRILRQRLYPKLKARFQFINEKKLFSDVDHHMIFSINIYLNRHSIDFISIVNLFDPITLEKCFDNSITSEVPGIKDDNNNWNLKGHPERVVRVTNRDLATFSKLLDNGYNAKSAKLPALHAQSLVAVLQCFTNHAITMGSIKEDIYTSEMWHETNAQKDDTIRLDTRFANAPKEAIYSGPNIGVSNPLFKTARAISRLNSDYDNIDLNIINDKYLPRTKYIPNLIECDYLKRIPSARWGEKYCNSYRLFTRKMLNLSGERSLIGALAPPMVAHMNGIIGFQYRDPYYAVMSAGLWASIPYDFLIKVIGKANYNFDSASVLPFPQGLQNTNIIIRTLLLNCTNHYFDALWLKMWQPEFAQDNWAKRDLRLQQNRFTSLTNEWNWHTPLRTDYERRQALVEIDVLTSLALGMTLEQLKTIYRIQFPVLQQYEADTWYDRNGRIAFTNNRSLTNVGFPRPEWEQIKDASSGIFTRTIKDDTQPGGPVERTIKYVAPFDRCDREQDYETAWKHFEERFAKEGKS